MGQRATEGKKWWITDRKKRGAGHEGTAPQVRAGIASEASVWLLHTDSCQVDKLSHIWDSANCRLTTKSPVMVPVQAGVKLMLMLQLVAGAREKVVVQSPEPDSSW